MIKIIKRLFLLFLLLMISLLSEQPKVFAQTGGLPFLYLPFRVVNGNPDYLDTMTSVFDHSSPNYSKADNKIIMFNAGIFDDNCFSINYDGTAAANCSGPIQSFLDIEDEYAERVYYNGHNGFDWAVTGSVYASASGNLTYKGWSTDSKYKCLGYMVIIDHQNGYRTIYGHMQDGSSNIAENSSVTPNTQIGIVGNTTNCGTSTGTHLHFQVEHYINNRWTVTDPFGWGSTQTDPLINFEFEISRNLWVNGTPTSYGGSVQQSAAVPANGRFLGGALIVDAPLPPAVVDTIFPSGYFTGPSNGVTVSSRTLTISANASDNSGGSGVREVRFKARWSGVGWLDIGADSSSPYSIQWDMCNVGVPQGIVDLDLDVFDNAGNKYSYSSNHDPLHITKNYDCTGSGLPSADQWHAEAWMNRSLAGYVNHDEYWPAGVTNTSYPFIGFEKDWGTGAPYSGFPSDQFSFKIYSNLHFNGGQYFFRVCSDDGVVLEIDGEKKIDEWWDRGGCLQTDKWLDNKYHTIEVRYFENTGNAYIKLYIWGEEYPRPEIEEPDGRITSPANNAFINQNPLTLWADAWDDKSGVNYVKFKVYHCVGGCQWRDIGTSYSPPYRIENWDWSALDGQQVKFAIDVFDKSGRSRSGAGGEITVNLDKTSPNISISSPTGGTVDEDKQIYINVSATDNGSGVGNVKFYAGYEGSSNYWHEIGNDTNSADGWGMNWDATALPNGTKAGIYSVAYDRAGNSSSAVLYGVSLGTDPRMYTFLPAVLNIKPVSVSIQAAISATEYDGYEDSSGFQYNSPRNWIGTAQNVMTGLVFSGINIPNGAVIKSADIHMYGYGLDGNATARIYGFSQDNSPAFTSNGSNRPSVRPSTAAYVDWTRYWPFAWTTFESPNLAQIVQEIINRPGWQAGNNIGFKITNPYGSGSNWSIEDFIQGQNHHVMLFITYEK